MLTLTWHVSKYKINKLHQRYRLTFRTLINFVVCYFHGLWLRKPEVSFNALLKAVLHSLSWVKKLVNSRKQTSVAGYNYQDEQGVR